MCDKYLVDSCNVTERGTVVDKVDRRMPWLKLSVMLSNQRAIFILQIGRNWQTF